MCWLDYIEQIGVEVGVLLFVGDFCDWCVWFMVGVVDEYVDVFLFCYGVVDEVFQIVI